MWVLLCRLECGLRRHHVGRHIDLRMGGHVLLTRVITLLLRLLRLLLLLLLLHHRTGCLRGVRTRRIGRTGTARREGFSRGVQGERLLGGYLCRTIGTSGAIIHSRTVLTLVADTRTVSNTAIIAR